MVIGDLKTSKDYDEMRLLLDFQSVLGMVV